MQGSRLFARVGTYGLNLCQGCMKRRSDFHVSPRQDQICNLSSRKLHLTAIVALSDTDDKEKDSTPPVDKSKKPDKIKVVPKIKTAIKYDDTVKSHKYITPFRACTEYMLDYSKMESLPKYYSRSPYSYEQRILVYRRDDVEKLAIQTHGNRETLELRIRKALKDQQEENAKLFDLKRALKYFRNDMSDEVEDERMRDIERLAFKGLEKPETLLQNPAGRVVLAAISINSINFLVKGITWWYTGSKSMFSEMLHSLADTINQIILAIGLHTSMQRPNKEHPYGYQSLRNISSLISGVAIFCLGSGLSMHQGILGIMNPEPVESYSWALLVLFGSFVSEGGTLILAYQQARRSAIAAKCSLRQYIRNGVDPSTNVVLLEDAVAVLGVAIAGVSMGMTALTANPIWDAVGGCGVAFLLGCVAYFIIWTNSETLIGKSIPIEQQEAIQRLVDRHKIIRGTYDVKATIIGGDHIRFKAEVDIDGAALTRRYLETLPLSQLLEEVKLINSEEGAAEFLMKHGDNIVNILGAEINNIEDTIKKEFPSVKHIDIEIN